MPHSKPEEFIRHRDVVMMDNNWLASPRWENDHRWLKANGIRCDFNQGLDARLIDWHVATRLASLKWVRFIRIACDSRSMVAPVSRAVQSLRVAGYSGEIFVYVLVREDKVEEALDRVEFLRASGCDPFAQPFRGDDGKVGEEPRRFARWVNHKGIFKSVAWCDYVQGYRG